MKYKETLEEKELKRKRAKQKMAVIAGFKPVSPLPKPVTTSFYGSALWPGITTTSAMIFDINTGTATVPASYIITEAGILVPNPERVETIATEKPLSWEDVDDIIEKL